jgi:cell division protein FtsZ
VVLIVTGLGGKTGSGVSAAVARAVKTPDTLVLGFASMPFVCEGNRRAQQAQTALEQLRAAGDGVVCLPNEKIMKLVGEEVGLRAVFTISDGLLADGLAGVCRLLSCRATIEIHFEDLRELLRANRRESFFAAAEASGENRAREAMEQLLKNPLLDGGESLANAGSVLVGIAGGVGLTMAEINRVMDQVNRQCDGAQIHMGATEDAALGDKLSVTLIATRRERIAPAPTATVDMGVSAELMEPEAELRPASRFVPLPTFHPEKLETSAGRKTGSRGRKGGSKMKQEQLSLEMNAKGCFDKSEPTIRNGEDLDEPTYLRRGLVLN